MLDDNHIKVVAPHAVEQSLIAVPRIFGQTGLRRIDEFTDDIEIVAFGDLTAEQYLTVNRGRLLHVARITGVYHGSLFG